MRKGIELKTAENARTQQNARNLENASSSSTFEPFYAVSFREGINDFRLILSFTFNLLVCFLIRFGSTFNISLFFQKLFFNGFEQ